MIDDEDDEDAYFHNDDDSREMCSVCCEWLLWDHSCPDEDCEHNHDDEDDDGLNSD